jgi:hypothetical protein
MIFTHTGLMGDFVQTWPIASWYYKQTGEKITFVLADVPCFKNIDELLLNQPFTKNLIKIPFPVKHWGMGGQPYKFNPAEYGIVGEYINLGFRDWPREKWIPYFVAAEYNLGVDLDYVIYVEGEESSTNNIVVNRFEGDYIPPRANYNDSNKRNWGDWMLKYYVPSRSTLLTPNKGLYHDLMIMKTAQHTYTSEGGIAAILDLMNINFTVYYKEKPFHPGWWFEGVYYKPNNLKRYFIALPESNIEPQLDSIV